MALIQRLHSSLKKVLCNPLLNLRTRQISSTTPCFDEEKDADEGSGEEQENESGLDSASPLLDAEQDQKPKPPPYAEELRKILTAKYLSNQPIARPHSLCAKPSAELSLQELRIQYKQRVSAVRKQYISELEKKRAAKAALDKKEREEIQFAKEERLRLKKERSAKRAIEVAEEKRILQEQLV
ncbi:hypothetical protein L7F22_023233 [Adiantum nelumboides]|nr:hypothetical protein [Adiantum nelumboides]